MKRILFLLIGTLITLSSCEISEEERAKIYYLDEDFILIEKEILIEGEGNVKYRFWRIHRINDTSDSVYIGEIKSKILEDDSNGCGCGDGEFYITNEMWYNKEVGSVLHFDYLRKDRFYPVKKIKGIYTTETGIVKTPVVEDNSKLSESEKLSVERRLIQIETEKRQLQIEKESLELQKEKEELLKGMN